jgi:hypothetical protein
MCERGWIAGPTSLSKRSHRVSSPHRGEREAEAGLLGIGNIIRVEQLPSVISSMNGEPVRYSTRSVPERG